MQRIPGVKKSDKENLMILTSNLLKSEPDLIGLIEKFMLRLPTFQENINAAHREHNTEEFSNLIHQLKGVGGGYGYPMLTELCVKIESQITSEDETNMKELMQEFDSMVEQILAGQEENQKIAEQAVNSHNKKGQ